jgi:hypothetical protein
MLLVDGFVHVPAYVRKHRFGHVCDAHRVAEARVLGAMEDEVCQPVLADVSESLKLGPVNEPLHDPPETLPAGGRQCLGVCSLVPELQVHGIAKEAWPTH